ncbi:SSI family serine proteinase inhibitor [Streptomyces sp. TP-A0874]|uniref:SSI family serine proteinase inhibitor n=1 Tax=Streptomyces sp. TP-A0874 TaxID=549819 RepID=UPI00085295C8|nr:SSI family serine proteinase inhibitor [Streptomyces sp. TP-A0874]
MPFRRLAVAALSTGLLAVPLAVATPVASAAPAAPSDSRPLPVQAAKDDRLTLTISSSGNRALDGTSTLDCHPHGGNHQAARAACDRLDALTRWGKDPFAPVDPDARCTMIYGGPVTARLTGVWAGRPVDARFSRSDGCEIARWDNLRPLLPDTVG